LLPTYDQPAGVESTITEEAALKAYNSDVDGVAEVTKRIMSLMKYQVEDAAAGVTSLAYIFTSSKCGYLLALHHHQLKQNTPLA